MKKFAPGNVCATAADWPTIIDFRFFAFLFLAIFFWCFDVSVGRTAATGSEMMIHDDTSFNGRRPISPSQSD